MNFKRMACSKLIRKELMMKYSINIWLVLALVLLVQIGLAKEIRVSPTGNLKSIKEAIDMAQDGDTILLDGGVYKEGQLILEKSITLIGKNGATIDGQGQYETLTVQADHVTIQGITFQRVGSNMLKDNAAIRIVKSKHCVISNNTLLDTYFGVYLENSDSCTVSNNFVRGEAVRETTSGNAIHLWYCKAATVKNNDVAGHRDGIYFEFVENSQIIGNHSEGNLRYGLHFMFSNDNQYIGNQFVRNGAGVAVMYSKRIEMTRNVFEDNQGPAAYGLLLKDITDSRIEKNIFHKNTTGILAEGSNRLELISNDFTRNGWAAKIMGSCEQLTIKENNFMGNTFEISTSSRNMESHVVEGNFWSSYSGYDLNRDGFGDVPHRPVRLFSSLLEQVPTAIVLIRSLFIDMLELAEKVTPSLTPISLVDSNPLMKVNQWQE